MTGRFIPNIYYTYEDIRTAPGHWLFAAQQQAWWVRLIMRAIILMGRVDVKYASWVSRRIAGLAFADDSSRSGFISSFPFLRLSLPLHHFN
jgi:hypothetical protein